MHVTSMSVVGLAAWVLWSCRMSILPSCPLLAVPQGGRHHPGSLDSKVLLHFPQPHHSTHQSCELELRVPHLVRKRIQKTPVTQMIPPLLVVA